MRYRSRSVGRRTIRVERSYGLLVSYSRNIGRGNSPFPAPFWSTTRLDG